MKGLVDDKKMVDGIPIKAVVPNSTASTSSFTQAVRWIKYCDSLHKSCSSPPDSVVPKRLLDIGMNKSRFALRVKLIETQGIEHPYVCLSHCWGAKTLPCLTTEENYDEHLEGIAWEAFPRTFQDAILFSRKLQMRYLWIDSLCIVQNDKLDWASEASNMSSIYRGAYVTIAATSSEDSTYGLFQEASTQLYDAHSLKISDSVLGESLIRFRRKLPHFSISSPLARPRNTAAQFPLLQRAWAYQERLLSSRILHFTANELVWECLEASSCQCSQRTEPFYFEGSDVKEATRQDPKLSYASLVTTISSRSDSSQDTHGVSEDTQREIIFSQWQDFVREYSKLNLTVQKDKLSALSGLAQQFNNDFRVTGKYIAGLWSADLERGLLWRLPPEKLRDPRPAVWRAPSFSWASVEGQVDYPPYAEARDYGYPLSTDPIPFVDILGISTVPLHGDIFGELATASLSILGPTVDAIITYDPRSTEKRGIDFKLNVEGGQVSEFYVDYSVHNVSDDHHIDSGEVVKCLRLRHLDFKQKVLSLVLKQVEPNICVYSRIGIAIEESQGEEIRPLLERKDRRREMLAGKWPVYHGMLEVLTII